VHRRFAPTRHSDAPLHWFENVNQLWVNLLEGNLGYMYMFN
jgi:hypothetical protein